MHVKSRILNVYYINYLLDRNITLAWALLHILVIVQILVKFKNKDNAKRLSLICLLITENCSKITKRVYTCKFIAH